MRREFIVETACSRELGATKAWEPIEPDPQPLERHPNPGFPGTMEVKRMESCCGHGRRYLTRKEKIEYLEEYKKELEQEVAGVAERIEELKKQE